MSRTPALLGGLIATLLLAGCDAGPPGDAHTGEAASPQADSAQARKLLALVEDYYDQFLELNPLLASEQGDRRFDAKLGEYFSTRWTADSLWIEQQALERLASIDPGRLDEEDLVTYEMFDYERRMAIEGFRYPSEWLPINQFSSLPVTLAMLGYGRGVQRFAKVEDYDNFLSRMSAFPAWVDDAIENMREGMARGVIQPGVVIEQTIPQLTAIVEAPPRQSVFWRPILNFPAGVPIADRHRLIDAYQKALEVDVFPAYVRLRDFLAEEYLPRTGARVGLSELPNGASWYAYLLRLYTGSNLEPDAVHALGLAEVARIRLALEAVAREQGHAGDLNSFLSTLRSDRQLHFDDPDAMLQAYRQVGRRVDAALQLLFSRTPESGLEIRAVESYREKTAAAASYQAPSANGDRPGVFYVNTYDIASRPRYIMDALYLNEAVPGMHFQRALAQESADLPRIRRFGRDTAYSDGWASYAETLGPDLGLYGDTYSRLGALSMEIWRAARLVVDTGLHSRSWSREQAMDYLRANTLLGEADVATEVDRYIAWPGRALACRVGELKILELRQRAAQRLGRGFDIREFHSQMLSGGALPLPVLERRFDRWLTAQE